MEQSQKPQSLYEKNQDLFRLISWGGMILLGIAALGIIIWFGTRPDTEGKYYDNISGLTFSTEHTGGITEGIGFIGVQLIEGADVDVINRAHFVIADYASIMYPDIERLSVQSGSVSQDNNDFTYTLVSNTDRRFKITVTDNQDGETVFKMSDENNEILNYDSKLIRTSRLNPITFGQTYLPQYFQIDDINYSVVQNKDGSYQISVNSCGDQAIKDKVYAETKKWIKKLGYDPDAISFKIPTLCDRGMRE